MFQDFTYHGIYRDDGFIIFKGLKNKEDINEWLGRFQEEVNTKAESDCLQFTAEVWNIEDDEKIINKKLTIIKDTYFPYLDMEMCWNKRDELKFQVHMKPNQKLRYINADSTHPPSTFKAIPSGVLNRLSKLTSKSKTLENTKIDKI